PVDNRKLFTPDFILDQKSHGCHDEATEVLTEKGWKPWGDYNWQDRLGTMNPGNHALEFQSPTAKHVYDYDGPMHYSSHSRLDFALTPNHRMYIRKWNEANQTLNPHYEFAEVGNLGWYVGLPDSTSGFLGTTLKKLAISDGQEFS